jgi:polyisoprenoid-binding protein YceI
MKVRRNFVLAAGTGIVAIVLIAAGGYVYFFSNLRSSPPSLALSASPTASAATTATSVAGTWTVTTGSQARYRVKELFVGETAKHDAVAQTTSVTGTLTVAGDATGYQASNITVTANLTSLHSIDQVAGRDVSQRDGIVSRQLEVQQFPNATFTAASASIAGNVTSAQVDVTVPGSLTIHGVTKNVTVIAKAQVIGGKLEIAGSVAVNMSDYGVSPPQVPFTAVDPTVAIEFDLFLTKT